MYNYELDMKELKFVAKEGEEKICEADVSIDDDVATVNFVSMKYCTVALGVKVCNATKLLLAEQGVEVDRVVCGNIAAMNKLDAHLSQMDKDIRETTKAPSMR